MTFNLPQTQVEVPARPSADCVLKQQRRHFANCYNCSAWGHHGYVRNPFIPLKLLSVFFRPCRESRQW